MTTLTKILGRIDALDDDFSYFSSRSKPPKKAAIDAVEKKLGLRLAPAHRELIETLGACAVIADEKVWPRPVAYEVAPLWRHHWGIEVFGVATKAALDVVAQTKARAPKGLVAAMGRSGGPTVGYDARGKLFEWTKGSKPSALGAKNLLVVLDDWLRAIAEDKAKLTTKEPGEEWLEKLIDDRSSDRTGAKLAKEKPGTVDLVVALIDKKIAKGEDAIPLLYGLGKAAKSDRVLSALRRYAEKGTSAQLRGLAINVLGTQGLEAKRVVPTLLACLDRPDAIGEAAYALQRYADPSMVKPLVAALAKIQKNKRSAGGVDESRIFETLAAAAKRAKGNDLDLVVDVLSSNLAPKDPYAALPVFDSLLELGPKAKRAVPALEKSADGKNKYLSALARRTLGVVTGVWEPHLDALKAAAKSKESDVSAVAEEGLRLAKKGATRRRTP